MPLGTKEKTASIDASSIQVLPNICQRYFPCVGRRLRSVKMEKRKLADQANTLVDLSKVGEASEKTSKHPPYIPQTFRI